MVIDRRRNYEDTVRNGRLVKTTTTTIVEYDYYYEEHYGLSDALHCHDDGDPTVDVVSVTPGHHRRHQKAKTPGVGRRTGGTQCHGVGSFSIVVDQEYGVPRFGVCPQSDDRWRNPSRDRHNRSVTAFVNCESLSTIATTGNTTKGEGGHGGELSRRRSLAAQGEIVVSLHCVPYSRRCSKRGTDVGESYFLGRRRTRI